jgi:hypothetical protein
MTIDSLKRTTEPIAAYLALEDLVFEPVADSEETDPYARLLGCLQLGNCLLHVDAIQVTMDGETQWAVDATLQDILDQTMEIEGEWHATFTTCRINGRDYVIIITPYLS